MSKSIVLSERQKPRAIQLMKAMYASHVANCEHGEDCPMMKDLKQQLETLQQGGEGNFSRSFGLK